jgi:ribose transport system permease protein
MLAAASIAGGLLVSYGSWIFMLGAIGMALLLGSLNGLAITWGKVVPFIATLAMLTVARGLALWMSDKTPISLIQLDILQFFGSGRVLGVPVPALIFVLVTIAGWVLLNRTTFGRHAIAVGGNRSAARIAGIRPGRVVFAVYVLTGLCVGISAILLSGRLASASPVVGNLVELDAIAAVVIGGTALTGGKATVTGTFFGVITFGLIFNLLNLLNMPSEIQGIVKGALIVIAVALQRRD